MLNPTDLHKYRNQKDKLSTDPAAGQLQETKNRTVEPSVSTKRTEENDNSQLELAELKTKRVNRAGDLCNAEYDTRFGTTVLSKKSGKVYQHMGYSGINGTRYLYPEETVFLLDAGLLELSCNNLPLSLEEGMSVVLPKNHVSWEQYFLYSYLSRAGFILKRYEKNHDYGVASPAVLKNTESSTIVSGSELRSPPIKQGRFDYAPCFSIERSKSEQDQPLNLDQLKGLNFPRTQWDFNAIDIPDSRGGSYTKVNTPNFDHLPVMIEYNELRHSCDARLFDTYSVRTRKKRDDFARPKNWVFVDQCSTWSEFKTKKEKLTNSSSIPTTFKWSNIRSEGSAEVETKHFRNVSNTSSTEKYNVVYDVYLSNSGYSLNSFIKPDRRIVLAKIDEPPPTAEDILALKNTYFSDDIPLNLAVVDGSDVLFFQFDSTITQNLLCSTV